MSRKLKIAREVLSEACSFLLSGYTPFLWNGVVSPFSTFEEFACVEDEIKSCAKKNSIRFQLTLQGTCWDEIMVNSLINFHFAHDFSNFCAFSVAE